MDDANRAPMLNAAGLSWLLEHFEAPLPSTTNLLSLLPRDHRIGRAERFWAELRDGGGALTQTRIPGANCLVAWTLEPALAHPRVALVSSRIGRAIAGNLSLAHAFRTLFAAASAEKRVALYADNGPLAAWFHRAACRHQVSSVRLNAPSRAQQATVRSMKAWKLRCLRGMASGLPRAWASPVLQPTEPTTPLDGSAGVSIPLADLLVTTLSDSLWALYMRNGGVIQSLIERAAAEGKESRVWLRTMDGAREEHALEPSHAFTTLATRAIDMPLPLDDSDRHNQSERGRDRWLTHATRAAPGPWPGERSQDYLDAILAGAPRRDSLQTLIRILRQQMVLATHCPRQKRGGADVRVVCFTAASFAWILNAKTYRKHRRRWDFESYGVAVRRPTLERLGACRVRYGDVEEWDRLSAEEHIFFQPRTTRNGSWDWSQELEWRLPGPLDLSRVARDEAIVFTRTASEAAKLRPFCRFPVLPLAELASLQEQGRI